MDFTEEKSVFTFKDACFDKLNCTNSCFMSSKWIKCIVGHPTLSGVATTSLVVNLVQFKSPNFDLVVNLVIVHYPVNSNNVIYRPGD